ncbi:Q antiterminator encoded by prophage CP-933P [Escherichia coli]|uniref:Q antiterminator encoded by prophage CP-933P n=1 Tax=Escherichia coli TaxID=562 RepID=A0A376P6U6_ECOLX|nr:Q antiterminator encoded by prophage CP-933P [Escherichia coli]
MKSILCAVSSFLVAAGDKNHRTGVRMNNQYLQFVREQLIIATADLSGATKGQLEAWQENAMFDTGRYRRKKSGTAMK